MMPAPTTSRSASAPRPPDLGWEPVSRCGDEHDHPFLRVLAGIGCGVLAAEVLYVIVAVAAYGGSLLSEIGLPVTAYVVCLLLIVLLVPALPIVFAWRWTNPGHYAVAYLMIWVPLTALFVYGFAGDWSPSLLIEYGLFSLGLPLCVVAWADWAWVLSKRRAIASRAGPRMGDWRLVAAGTAMYVSGVVLAVVACGAVFLLPVGVVLAVVGFLMPDPRPSRPRAQVYSVPFAAGPPPACPSCTTPLVWAASVGRWACPACGTYV